jgi:hypothetical protein
LLALLALALMSPSAFGQTTASLSGTVADASQGVLPGATVTAINTETGVETTATANNSGVYNFPSLQPGTYNVRASKEGFQAKTTTDVRLRIASQNNLPFALEVAGTSTEVEVTASAENMILEAGASTGTILQEDLMATLPLISNDVMDLVNVMGGVVKSEDPIFSNYTQTIGGVAAGNINVQRDGISVSEVRWASGAVSPSRVNQEMVGEFKMILSPVDAEMGRGAGQLQMITKSGANAFHGSGVWNIQNTALDAEEWYVKKSGGQSPWRNLHNYTVTMSGPIVKNKTFFFATWDHQIVREKTQVTYPSLTPCARLGIYRYFEGWNNLNANPANTASVILPGAYPGAVPARIAVYQNQDPAQSWSDPKNGSPLYEAPGGAPVGALQYQSVLGPLDPGAKALLQADEARGVYDCSSLLGTAYAPSATNPLGGTTGTSWVSAVNGGAGYSYGGIPITGVRDGWDASGYVDRFNPLVPLPNYYNLGDGLNIAGYRWTRTTKGANTVYGTGQDGERKSISVKIDHNINSAHRLSGTYNFERLIGEDGQPSWDNGYSYGGNILRKPQSFTVALTSTLRPTLLNEFRFGLSQTYSQRNDAIDANPELTAILYDLMPTSTAFPVVIGYDSMGYTPGMGFGTATYGASHPVGNMALLGDSWGGTDNRWTASDTVTWMKGAHSFKGGFEVRLSKSLQNLNGNSQNTLSGSRLFPNVSGGAGSTPYLNTEFNPVQVPVDPTNPYAGTMPDPTYPLNWANNGMVGGESGNGYTIARSLLDYLSGSVNSVTQFFYAKPDMTWNSVAAGENQYEMDLRGREFAAFFKDDWKITNDLTLNLGARWEYYGVPWENNGMTVALKGGSTSIWGPCGDGANIWTTGVSCTPDPSYEIGYQFVGPNSDHPDISPWNKDLNNFAPHVGFAWQLPWLGKGKTTLRGGYSISYTPVNNFGGYVGFMTNVPGATYMYQIDGLTASNGANRSLNLLDVKNGATTGLMPLADPATARGIDVLGPQGILNREKAYNVYDENIRNPYVQSLNLSLTRQLGNALTVDVRYIGTLSRKRIASINVNTANYLNNGLFELFEAARYPDAAASPSALAALAALFPANSYWPGLAGAAQLRGNYGVLANLVSGNYSGLASSLANANTFGSISDGINGKLMRSAGMPENFIIANPALAPTGSWGAAGAGWNANMYNSNYHSMQAQVTMRPVRGLSFQATYTWSRNLADQGIVDYTTMNHRYYLDSMHRTHALTSYGSYELPFGANGFLFRNATGAFKKAIEGWSLSWVASASSGIPMSISGVSRQWGNSDVMLERPDLWDNKAGRVTADPDPATYYGGYFYGDKYVRVEDPQCAMLDPSLYAFCTGAAGSYFGMMKALALSDPSQADGVARYGITAGTPSSYTSASGWTYGTGDPVIVFRNPLPTEVGNFGPNQLTGPGKWSLDMAMAKSIEFMEGKKLEIRVDAQNIFNHPLPSNSAFRWNARFTQTYPPETTLNAVNPNTFGILSSKGGHRTFQAKIRLSF